MMTTCRHAIGVAWLVTMFVGCTNDTLTFQPAAQTWRGDKTGHLYNEAGPGYVEDMTNGIIYPRVNESWLLGAHGHLLYLYAGMVEEPQQWAK